MRRVLVGAAVLTCVATSPAVLLAHPGHDHWQGAPSGEARPPVHSAAEQTAPALADLVLGVTVFAALAAVGAVLIKNRATRYAVVAPAAVVLVAGMGCGDRSGEGPPDDRPQARHDVKQLEDLFGHFKADGVGVRSDADYFYIESNAFPKHPMMVGITAWQQQVPLPQPYTGKNAWQIPLRPVVSDKPISAKKALYRGAIALAVNGVPIFNALNNRGEDAYLAGELDEYGGHCGRGDDYHYHIAPVHLEKVVGKGKPIAYALDGFPIYGYTDREGKEPADLDKFNGRFEKNGSYRYYSTKKYPYINGGMRGVVTVRGDQIEPQPRDAPVRPAGEPLRGAKIKEFNRDDKEKTYVLKYELQGGTYSVRYTIGKDDSVTFTFTDSMGKERTDSYRRRPRK